jgi:hypothetical protein
MNKLLTYKWHKINLVVAFFSLQPMNFALIHPYKQDRIRSEQMKHGQSKLQKEICTMQAPETNCRIMIAPLEFNCQPFD